MPTTSWALFSTSRAIWSVPKPNGGRRCACDPIRLTLSGPWRALALRRGDAAALAEAATQIITLQPNSPEGYGLRALSEINRQQFSAADADIRKAIEVAPQNSFGYVQMGNLKFAQKQYIEAEKAYQQALDLNANSKDALRGLMNIYVAQKQIDRAIAAANAQIAKSPNNGSFYDLLGSLLFSVKKDLSSAETAFRKSVELDKNNSEAVIKLGQVQAARGEIDQAIATCQQALQDLPNTAQFYTLLGELYETKRDWSKAQAAYEKTLALQPDDPVAANNLANVMLQSGGNVDVAYVVGRVGAPWHARLAGCGGHFRLDLLSERGLWFGNQHVPGSSQAAVQATWTRQSLKSITTWEWLI